MTEPDNDNRALITCRFCGRKLFVCKDDSAYQCYYDDCGMEGKTPWSDNDFDDLVDIFE